MKNHKQLTNCPNLFAEGELLDLTEASAENNTKTWDVVLIKTGLSKNGTYYSEKVLRQAAPLFEGSRALVRSDDAHSYNADISVKNIAGFYSDVEYREGGLRAKLHLLESAYWLHKMLLESRKIGHKNPFGLSIVASGSATLRKRNDRAIKEVDAIESVVSVDPVVLLRPGVSLLI
jgi:hypothetical protein